MAKRRHDADTDTTPASGRERRHAIRLENPGMVANIGGKLVKVIDISARAVGLEKGFTMPDGPTTFTLYPMAGDRVDLNRGLRLTGVLAHEEDERVVVRFQPPSLKLVKLLVAMGQPADAGA